MEHGLIIYSIKQVLDSLDEKTIIDIYNVIRWIKEC